MNTAATNATMRNDMVPVFTRLGYRERRGDAISAGVARVALASLAVAVLFVAGCSRPGPKQTIRNVLLISIDSLRADRVGAYGYGKATTPTIDRLAAEGVVFTNAVSTTSWTLPAHAALLTGVYDARHGATVPTATLSPSIATLAEAFRAAGYRTAGFYSGPFLHPHFGFGRGFEEYVDCTSYELENIGNPASGKAHASSHKDITNPRIAANFAATMKREDDRPFFFFVHMWDPHYELVPPPPYDSMFSDGPLPDDPVRDFRHDPRFRAGMSDETRGAVMALYDGEIRFTDDTIARLLAELESRKLLDDTVVVITSDHGDEFLEHGGKGHKQTLYQEVLHIPLVFWAKGMLPAARATATASLVDVAPSLARLAGISELADVDGTPLFDATGRALDAERTVFAELRTNPARVRHAAAIRFPMKLLRDGKTGTEQLFDLANDPGEQRPADAAIASQAQPLRDALDTYLAVTLRSSNPRRTPSEPLPPGMKKRLRELGYLD